MNFLDVLNQSLARLDTIDEWRNIEDKSLSMIADRAATGPIGLEEINLIKQWVISQKPELGNAENELVLNNVVNNIRESLESAVARYKKSQEGSVLQRWAYDTIQTLA